jgi:uncharacterized protein with GYD domain
MARFLFEGRYNGEGIKGVLKEGGSGRKAAVEAAVKSMGGRVESYYFAFGETDVYVIVDGIDNVAAAALAMGISSSGAVGVKTTVLLTVDEIDAATKKTLSYRAPGR